MYNSSLYLERLYENENMFYLQIFSAKDGCFPKWFWHWWHNTCTKMCFYCKNIIFFSVEPWTSRYMLDPMTNCTHSRYWCTHRIKKENYQHWHNILCLFSFMLIAQKTSHAYNTYYLMIAWKRNFKHGCSFSIRKKKKEKTERKKNSRHGFINYHGSSEVYWWEECNKT